MTDCRSPYLEQSYGRFRGFVEILAKDLNKPYVIQFQPYGDDFSDLVLDSNNLISYTGCRDRPFTISIKTGVVVKNPNDVCNNGYLSLETFASNSFIENETTKISDSISAIGQNRITNRLTSNSNSYTSLLYVKNRSTISIWISPRQISKIDPNTKLELEIIVSLVGTLTSYKPKNKQISACCTEKCKDCRGNCIACYDICYADPSSFGCQTNDLS